MTPLRAMSGIPLRVILRMFWHGFTHPFMGAQDRHLAVERILREHSEADDRAR